MRYRKALIAPAVAAMTMLVALPLSAQGGGWTLIGWNDLGMHCMDADFSVFSILPPYNTIHAQLIDSSGDLVTNPGRRHGHLRGGRRPGRLDQHDLGRQDQLLGPRARRSSGRRSARRGPRRLRHARGGATPRSRWPSNPGAPAGSPPRASRSRPTTTAGHQEPLPDDAAGGAGRGGQRCWPSTDIVLPVSDEMDCRACHASGSGPAARALRTAGSNDPDPERDYRLNILALHDDHQAGNPAFQTALAAAGYNPAGPLRHRRPGTAPVLCAACHASNALPGTGRRRSRR